MQGEDTGWRKMSPGQKSRGSIGQGSGRDEKEAKGILWPCQVDMGRAGEERVKVTELEQRD